MHVHDELYWGWGPSLNRNSFMFVYILHTHIRNTLNFLKNCFAHEMKFHVVFPTVMCMLKVFIFWAFLDVKILESQHLVGRVQTLLCCTFRSLPPLGADSAAWSLPPSSVFMRMSSWPGLSFSRYASRRLHLTLPLLSLSALAPERWHCQCAKLSDRVSASYSQRLTHANQYCIYRGRLLLKIV